MSRLISIINLLLFCLIVAISGLIAQCFIHPKEDSPIIIPKIAKTELPKNPFAQPEMAYLSILEGPFITDWKAPKMQLPDLREELIYTGKNARPDMANDNELSITLKSSGESKTVPIGQKIYLQYKGNFVFTHNNRPSSLWIEFFNKKNEEGLDVCVALIDDKGQLVETPESYSQFELIPKEIPRPSSSFWEIGGCRVDSTLLVRQRARWIGEDLFLEIHGGDEFAHIKGKQRIDFLGENSYSCFAKEGDFLIWKHEKWQQLSASQKSLGYPLMVVKKIDDKLMTLELWDIEGKNKTLLHLIRTKEATMLPNLNDEFKFVGAKTWAQFVVESHNERLLIKPEDWLLYTDGQWKKICSAEEIDDYVSQRLTGPLFILDKMIKQNGKQVLVGHIFNSTRTEMMEIELPAQQTSIVQRPIQASPLPPPGMAYREKDNHHSPQLDTKAQQLSRGMYQNLRGNIQDE